MQICIYFVVNVPSMKHDKANMQYIAACQKEENNCSSLVPKPSMNEEMKSIKKLWTPMPLSPQSILSSPKAVREYHNVQY